jgi:hypothetical protein
MADEILAELEQAVAKPPTGQIELSVAIERAKTAVRQIVDAMEEFQQRAKATTPTVEPESLALREDKIKEIKAAAGL